MKRLVTVFFTAISVIAYSQKFEFINFFTITKLTKEQLESKHEMQPKETIQGKFGTYYVYDFKFKDEDWSLQIFPDKDGNINSAQISTFSPQKDRLFAELQYVLREFATKWEVIDNKTKKSIPYFTQDEFSKGYYGKTKQDELDLLKNKSGQITYKITEDPVKFINSQDMLRFFISKKN